MPPLNLNSPRTNAPWPTTDAMTVRKRAFRLLAALNRAVLPKQWHRDLARLSTPRKLLAAYRYWVTRNAL